jgi:hypothetical protein
MRGLCFADSIFAITILIRRLLLFRLWLLGYCRRLRSRTTRSRGCWSWRRLFIIVALDSAIHDVSDSISHAAVETNCTFSSCASVSVLLPLDKRFLTNTR